MFSPTAFSSCRQKSASTDGLRLQHSNPMLLEDVAIHFPDIQIVVAHPSWPWQDEALSLAMHKPNAWIDLSGWSPKYFAPQLVQYANTLLKDHMFSGSDFPLIMFDRSLKDFDEAGFQGQGKAVDSEGQRGAPARIGSDGLVPTSGLPPDDERLCRVDACMAPRDGMYHAIAASASRWRSNLSMPIMSMADHSWHPPPRSGSLHHGTKAPPGMRTAALNAPASSGQHDVAHVAQRRREGRPRLSQHIALGQHPERQPRHRLDGLQRALLVLEVPEHEGRLQVRNRLGL